MKRKNNSGFEKEGVAKATVGEGNITTTSNVDELNRDETQSMLVTKNERTGGLDGSLTVDNMLLTNPKEYMESVVSGNPINISRKVDKENGDDVDAPTFLPSLWTEKSATGKEFRQLEDGLYYENMGGGEYQPIGDGTKPPSGIINQYDSNPLLKTLWHVFPGFSSFTKYHDYSVDKGTITPENKANSIPFYLFVNTYGAAGTVLDVSNWKWPEKIVNNNQNENIDNK